MLRVVERRLDLVQDVERARPREEHGEHEGERDERLLAARQQRQALGRLAGRRDLDLDAGRLEIEGAPSAGKPTDGSAAGPVSCSPSAPRSRPRRRTSARRAPRSSAPPSTGCGRGALTRRRRPEPPGNSRSITSSKLRAAASNVSSKLSRMRRSVSRIRPRSSASASSRSLRCASSSSTCSSASSYSRSASGFTGPRRSRRRSSRSSRASSSSRSSASSGSAATVDSGSRPRRPATCATSAATRLLAVADLRHPHLLLRELLAGLAQLGLKLVLAPRQLAQLGGDALALRLVGAQLLLEARRATRLIAASAGLHRRQRAARACGQRGPVALQRALERRHPRRMTRALGCEPVGDAALGGDLGLELRPARVLGAVAALAALVREPRTAGAPLPLPPASPRRASRSRASSASRCSSSAAAAAASRDRGLARLARARRVAVSTCGLEAGEPVALGQVLLAAAGGQAPHLAAAAVVCDARRA